MAIGRGLIRDERGALRCWWVGDDPLYVEYHDCEWGRPVVDDDRLFEKICLEGFQAGLSWITILRKRAAFRNVFHNFNIAQVARMDSGDVNRLLGDAGIIRHRGKIESTINNAKRALELRTEHGSLAAYFWQWEPGPRSRPRRVTQDVLARLGPPSEATALSRDLKRRGWTFVGPTTIYAFMQAMGIVNDHLDGCSCRNIVEQARTSLARPYLAR